MKNAFVAVENHEEITPEVKQELDLLAEKKHVQIRGIIEYPRGMILDDPEAFVDMLKQVKVDTIFVTSPEFIIHEIKTDGKLAELAKRDGISIIDTTLEIDIADMKEAIPDFYMKELKSNIENMMDTSLKEMMKKSIDKNRAMIITKDSNVNNIKELMDDLAKQGYYNFSIIEMSGYVSPMDQMLETTIQDQKVDKIVVADDYDSAEFNECLKRIKEKGIEVTFESNEMCNTMNRMFMN